MFKPKPIESSILVGSGRIVVANDLRDVYPEGDKAPQNADGALWQKEISEAFGDAGLLHGYVGNSCPGIWDHKGVLIIGTDGYDEDYNSTNEMPGKCVGDICTDLWWYSIADHNDYVERGGIIGWNVDVIEVEVGRYVLRHYYPHFGKSGIRCGSAEIFATLHKSNEILKPWKLPEEGVAKMLVNRPEISYACVYHAEDKPMFSEYKIMIHWEADLDYRHIKDIFTNVYYTWKEISDSDLVIRRAFEAYEKKATEQKKRDIFMNERHKKLADMSPEERTEHDKKMKEIFERIKKDLRR